MECCPEIFGAVEKITSRAFDIIVSDWNEGLEAAFLLKTSRELKANHAAFTIAIADPDSAEAAYGAGADLVLSRPIISDEVKYALLTCDPFLAHMKLWLPKLGFPEQRPREKRDAQAMRNPVRIPIPKPASIVPEAPRPLRAWPSPPPPHPRKSASPSPVVAAESIFDENLFYRSRVQTAIRREPSFSSATNPLPPPRRRNRQIAAQHCDCGAFLSVGYVFSEPLYSHGTSTSVVQMWGRAWAAPRHGCMAQMRQRQRPRFRWPRTTGSDPAPSRRSASHIRVTPVRDPYQSTASVPAPAQPEPLQVETQPVSRPQPAAASAVRIPESLKSAGSKRDHAQCGSADYPCHCWLHSSRWNCPKISPANLLLQQVLPSYPEKAIRARLQGAVVLQAFIARDGTIQDLKLIRGSFLLGQAAYRAVRQWRYQPYLINGRAVEAQTLVTVDFKLP